MLDIKVVKTRRVVQLKYKNFNRYVNAVVQTPQVVNMITGEVVAQRPSYIVYKNKKHYVTNLGVGDSPVTVEVTM
jgi:hypothetical protein